MNIKTITKSAIEHCVKSNDNNQNRVFARQLTRKLTRSELNKVAGGVTCVSTGYPKTDDYDCGF